MIESNWNWTEGGTGRKKPQLEILARVPAVKRDQGTERVIVQEINWGTRQDSGSQP